MVRIDRRSRVDFLFILPLVKIAVNFTKLNSHLISKASFSLVQYELKHIPRVFYQGAKIETE